jgi:hypothetical protein
MHTVRTPADAHFIHYTPQLVLGVIDCIHINASINMNYDAANIMAVADEQQVFKYNSLMFNQFYIWQTSSTAVLSKILASTVCTLAENDRILGIYTIQFTQKPHELPNFIVISESGGVHFVVAKL